MTKPLYNYIEDAHYSDPAAYIRINPPVQKALPSHEPNTGMAGNIMWVDARNIKAGEEISFDYAM